jgi:hypothetical protein
MRAYVVVPHTKIAPALRKSVSVHHLFLDTKRPTIYTRPRRRRWEQLVSTSWLSVGAVRDGHCRRLNAATGREGPGAGVLYAAL